MHIPNKSQKQAPQFSRCLVPQLDYGYVHRQAKAWKLIHAWLHFCKGHYGLTESTVVLEIRELDGTSSRIAPNVS